MLRTDLVAAVSEGYGSTAICWEAICVTLLGRVKGNNQRLDGS